MNLYCHKNNVNDVLQPQNSAFILVVETSMYSEIEQMGSPRAKTIEWRPNFYTNVFSTSLDKVNHVQIINLILSHKASQVQYKLIFGKEPVD